ncbi:lipid A biosynthesis acyltransferase [Pseudohalioglobus sediminis]|uniref:Lipid A biosynthesis acyltransferase n=1 Tax=Pseudohalioglobus sediminis TaxID=2606449 RepID=A0A5B0WVS7_9GAMM|nr:lipid A biosynthesis acyltransferase [Pseudohalioglobus sediminis]KAA1190488.1 lipid A biosynthesis acyltransferase [Pseudohalioglobus sediminis]
MADSQRWSEIRENGFLTGMRFLFLVYRLGGFLAFRIILQPVLLFYFLRNKLARDASLEYLGRLQATFPDDNTPAPGWWNAYRHFNAFANASLDRLAVWANSSILDRISFPDRPILLEQIATGRGAVLLGAHIGNMEICRGLSTRNPDLKLNILVHTQHADMFNRLLREVVGETAITLIEVSDLSPATAIELQGRVDRGEFVAILADRVPASSSERCSEQMFLGKQAKFPDGPFILASLLKCPVYTLFCTREGRGYKIRCQKFADDIKLPRSSRKQAVTGYSERYSRALEQNLRHAPLQWFNFYPFWDQE